MNDFNFDQANYNDLLAEAKRLNSEVDTLKNKIRYYDSAIANRTRQYELAKKTFTELLEANPDLFGDDEVLTEIMDEFDIEILQIVHFTITAEISGSMEIRKGTEPDHYSFDVTELYYDGNSVDISDCSVSDLNYDFD